MRWFFVKPPVYDDDGAIHFGLGKFILPIPGNAKEATEKGKKVLAIVACVLVAVLLIVAIVLGIEKKAEMPLRQELLNSVGKPIADVAAQLEVPQEEMQQIASGLYCIPAACEYADVTFDILLYFEENEHLLRGFGYEASYHAEADEATDSIAAIVKVLSMKEMTLSDGAVIKPDKKELKTYIADHGAITVNETLDAYGNEAVWNYIDYLESTDYYEGKIDKYIKKQAVFYRDLNIDYQASTQTVTMKLWYTIETDRNVDY